MFVTTGQCPSHGSIFPRPANRQWLPCQISPPILAYAYNFLSASTFIKKSVLFAVAFVIYFAEIEQQNQQDSKTLNYL
jgi:hypothetical protein